MRNILIVGETGVGKSSLVNLIAGDQRANTSGGCSQLCTAFHSQEYIVTLDGVEFTLHDTAGLHSPQGNMEPTEYLNAVRGAYALISRLERSGGISLLVFCMRGGRISITMQQTYNFFVNVFCSRRVPVVIVVTHLETYDDMEEWWRENGEVYKTYGLGSLGHACITTTRGLEGAYSKKYEQSREVVRKLLLDYSGRIAWKRDKASWVTRVALNMHTRLSPRCQKQLERSLRKKLVKQCGFSVKDAKFVAQKIVEPQRMSAEEYAALVAQEPEIEQLPRMSEEVPEEENVWIDEMFGPDSSSCVPIYII